MGIEKVDFMWYAKKITASAALGYFAGIAVYLAQDAFVQQTHLFATAVPQITNTVLGLIN